MLGVDPEPYTLAGAFLLGALLATVAVLRILRAVTDYLAGVERRRRLEHRAERDEPEG